MKYLALGAFTIALATFLPMSVQAGSAAIPSASSLLAHDPRIHSCKQDGYVCRYENISTTSIPGVIRGEDIHTLWGVPTKSYAVRISGKRMYAVEMSSGTALGPTGIILYAPDRATYVAAFREISHAVAGRTSAVGIGAWNQDTVLTTFALEYDPKQATLRAAVTGTAPNCDFIPSSDNGIEIGQCRRSAHTYLRSLSFADAAPFRPNAAEHAVDRNGPWRAKVHVLSQQSTPEFDRIPFTGSAGLHQITQGEIAVGYAFGVVRNVRFTMRFQSTQPEISPADLLASPRVFPIAKHLRFLSRAKTNIANDRANIASIFHYRSDIGEFTITQHAVALANKGYEIDAAIDMTKPRH